MTTIAADRPTVNPFGSPPSFFVRTERTLCEVEVAPDPSLFQRALASRRTRRNFSSSREAGVIPVTGGVAAHTLDDRAWATLARWPHLFYRAVCYDGPPETPQAIERTVDDETLAKAPSVRVVAPASPPIRRNLSADLPWLRVQGNRVVDEVGDVVVLRGVNRSGMEYTGRGAIDPTGTVRPTSREGAGITPAEIAEIVRAWGANVVRIPINAEWALTRRDYRRNLDRIVEWSAAEGAYTLLALARLDARREFGRNPDGTPNRTAPQPDETALAAWSLLSARYCLQPAVLYDVYSAPHEPLPTDTSTPPDPTASEDGRVAAWHRWARRLETAVHRENGRALLFVSGWRLGLDLRSFPVKLADGRRLPNAVYAAHAFPDTTPDGAADFDEMFGAPSLRLDSPIFLAAWGGDSRELTWGTNLESWARARHRYVDGVWQGLAGWTAWSWADDPLLVERESRRRGSQTWRPFTMRDGHNVETSFGELVRGSLGVMPWAVSAEFDAARPRGSRTRYRITVSGGLIDDFFLVRGHDFVPGTTIAFSRGGNTKVVAPDAVLPHLLVIANLPADGMPLGNVAVEVRRPDGVTSEAASATVRTGPVPEGLRVIVPGASKRKPYTIAFVSNAAIATFQGDYKPDLIMWDQKLFHRVVTKALTALFASSESLLHPYAHEIRVVSLFFRDFRPRDSIAYCWEINSPNAEDPTMGVRTWDLLLRVIREGETGVDVAFAVFHAEPLRSSSVKPATDDQASPGRRFFYDLDDHAHRALSEWPSGVALGARHADSSPFFVLHEFAHAAGSETDGILGDLYDDEKDLRFEVNRKRRQPGDPLPRWFARYDGVPYRTDLRRDGLGYPPGWRSFSAELADPSRPNLMDAYTEADDELRCRLDLLSLRFLRDRIEWRLAR